MKHYLSIFYSLPEIREIVLGKSHGAFHVYKAGVFIVVEIPRLNLQIKWDEGTRVYIKVGYKWRDKVNGLCGNYNNNAMDDMKTPSHTMASNVLAFIHSWKAQEFCALPTLPADACQDERPSRAQRKCSVLLSNKFKVCSLLHYKFDVYASDSRKTNVSTK